MTSTWSSLQGLGPDPIVAECPLGERRKRGHHLVEQVVVGDLRPQDPHQHDPHEIVAGAHRETLVGPVRIDFGRRSMAFVHDPELPQAVPSPVGGNEFQEGVILRREMAPGSLVSA